MAKIKTLVIPPDLHAELKAEAASQQITLQQYIIEILGDRNCDQSN